MIRPIWAEINLDHIAHNVHEFRKVIPAETQIMVAVKADGYGHGAVEVSKQALAAGATQLAVASVEEGVELRQADIQAPILVLGFTPPTAAEEAIRWKLTQTVYQQEQIEAFEHAAAKLGTIAKVHIKVDTGMGRIGVQAEEAADFIEFAYKQEHLLVEGVFSHFSTADELDKSYAKGQIVRWKKLMAQIAERGIHIPIRHFANSAAAIDLPEVACDMIRLGIGLYGLYPSEEVNRSAVELRQALSLKSQIVHLKRVQKGAGISYGATPITRDDALIATVPVGYADGYSRLLAGKAVVLVHGKRVSVFGRICMDQFMIDVTDIPGVKLGDEVVLYGSQGDEMISLDEVADWMGTISYEVTCNLGKRVPRQYHFTKK